MMVTQKHGKIILMAHGRYSYYEKGEGAPLVILHGLMGGLSNFDGVAAHFSTRNNTTRLAKVVAR